MKIGIKKLTKTAQIPTKSNESDAGFDLYADVDTVLLPRMYGTISTGIAFDMSDKAKDLRERKTNPTNIYVRIAPRSGLANSKGIDVLAGVVDADYTGEVKVIIMNNGRYRYEIKKGDRIAQAIPTFIPVVELNEIGKTAKTKRAKKGFGSSGK